MSADMPELATGGTLKSLIDAQAGAALATDDVLTLVLPLFAQVAELHARGRVALLNPDVIVLDEGGALRLGVPEGQSPTDALAAIHRVQPHPASTLNIIGELRRSHDASGAEQLSDLAVQTDSVAPIERPVYVPGFGSWELQLGHHDEITDVASLGLVLATLACGLDFDEPDHVRNFAAHRRNLFVLAPRLHPVVAAVIVEMTALNRHERATDVASLATRLRTWRDQPEGLDVERALIGATGVATRRTAVLTHLRNRLFDLSRRNRLLHFRPTASTVNLTVSSVPLVLQLESIRAEHLCTWGGTFAADLVAGRTVDLHRWLRFEDQPYLPVALDKLIQETRRDRAEFGFSNLRLVIGFLRWHNLKETPEERIVTPLLWLPVELTRRKGVRDQYLVRSENSEAEFNPVLRHQLRQLYDIRLPEAVDLATTSIAQIHTDLLAQIQRTEPSVELRLIDKPQIRMVRQKALQRLHQFQRRRTSTSLPHDLAARLPDYSYERDDYRPLGQALFERWVRPNPLPQRFEAGAAPVASARHLHMVAESPQGEERLGYALQESDGHRYAWDMDLAQVSLVNFNYRKMSLVRDYTQLIDTPSANEAFDGIFSIEPRAVDNESPPPVPLCEQWNVVASDATQNAAVALARSGRSFIIQGPPGTGKSQTITNLIADYVGQGKRVLFVCEKRAALDVVFHRLKQAGLDALCSLIHDSQADKKAFIADLRTCYETWVARPHNGEALAAQRNSVLATLDRAQQSIETFEQAMSAVPDALGSSVRQLIRRIAALPAPPNLDPAANEQLPSLAVWDRQRELADRMTRQIRERAGVDTLAGHPFAHLSTATVNDAQAYAKAERSIDQCEKLLDALAPFIDSATTLLEGQQTPDDALLTAREAQWLLDQGLVRQLELLEQGGAADVTLQRERDTLALLTAALAEARAATTLWHDRLRVDDTRAALTLAQRLERAPLRWLQPAWWRLRGELHKRYNFAQHAVHPGYSHVLHALMAEHDAVAALQEANAACCARYGVESLEVFLQALAQWRERIASQARSRRLVDYLRATEDPLAAARSEAAVLEPLAALVQRVNEGLDIPSSTTLDEIAELLRDLREALEDLPDFLPALRAVHAADPAVAYALRNLPFEPDVLEALVTAEALRRVEREAPAMARFDGVALARAARTVASAEGQLRDLNARVVQATVHRKFTDHVRQSLLSASQLDADGKDFKKRYSKGRRELEHEFGKSMRHRTIRDLAGDETGLVVDDLKPIWLMSPLSVSDTLPLSPELFDVVIFDEASQIPTEEAVPALSRARQIVVVGDEMQLPPTSFFSASGDGGEEDDVMIEEGGEQIAISLDSDSLLNQAARNLSATLLAWHYRSRHESLISFSNAAFYDGRLVTIPDRSIESTSVEMSTLRSDQADAGRMGVHALLERAISWHLLADGVYLSRRNAAEARYIAQMVRELLRHESGMSLGIVAFSEAQQDEIESALAALAAEDETFALQLDNEYLREDDGQFNGLFVKNLENVQGDERDIIILSICYAPGPDGRMLMNFGPINQRGGEKRLNVIFSRARHRMAVVSSIQAEAITNLHNDGAAALRAFLQFAQASARGEQERARQVLGTLNAGARDTFTRPPTTDEIRTRLAEALRQRGHLVHEHVGRSQFRCDLAIVDPAGSDYRLAILLDSPGKAIADVRERYVFHPGVLQSFGWRTLDVPGRDWLRAPDAVLARIERALGNEEEAQDFDEPTGAPIESAMPQQTSPPEGLPPAATAAEATEIQTRRFQFQQGTSHKFWQISLADTELTVRFGRIGSQGQTTLKSFDSADRAEREMEKLVAEKLRKGYVEE